MDDKDDQLSDYQLGFIAAVLYTRGIFGQPTEEQFREAYAVLAEFMSLELGEQELD